MFSFIGRIYLRKKGKRECGWGREKATMEMWTMYNNVVIFKYHETHCFVCVSLHCVCTWCKRAFNLLKLKLYGCELLRGCWHPNPDLRRPKTRQMLLTPVFLLHLFFFPPQKNTNCTSPSLELGQSYLRFFSLSYYGRSWKFEKAGSVVHVFDSSTQGGRSKWISEIGDSQDYNRGRPWVGDTGVG